MKGSVRKPLTTPDKKSIAIRLSGSKRKIWTIVGAAGVASAICGVLLVSPAGAELVPGQDRPHATAIPALAPSDADTFVIAPYSKEWWNKVASMTSPETRLSELDPSAAGATIDNLGYSRSQDHVTREIPRTGALRLFYAESPSAADAEKVAAWLREAEGFEGRRVYLNGRTVIVAPSWVTDFQPPVETMESVPGYAAQISDSTAAMWRNVDREIPSLVGDTTSERAAVMSTVMSRGYGFTSGTTWVGTSRSGDSWSGAFKSGGVDPEKIDFKATQDAVGGSQKVLKKVEFSKTKYAILDSGMTGVFNGASFLAPNQNGRLGSAMPANVPVVKDAAITAVTDVTRFNAAASGIDAAQEKVASQAISANKSEMLISFGFTK